MNHLNEYTEFDDLVQYRMPSYILEILDTHGIETCAYVKDLETKLDFIQRLGIKALKMTQNIEQHKEISDMLKDFKNQYYIHFVSMLAYSMDDYKNDEDHQRMQQELNLMMEEYTMYMNSFLI